MEVDWEARRAYVTSDPPADRLDALGRAIGARSVTLGPRLRGGVITATHVVVIDAGSQHERRLVLKCFPADDYAAAAAESEWERLCYAQHCPVPTPEPVAEDIAGAWFGVSALLMTSVPGRAPVLTGQLDTRLRELATAMAAIHNTVMVEPVSAAVSRPHSVHEWRGPQSDPGDRGDAIAVVIRELGAGEASLPRVLCHGDFHPGNTLFVGTILSGVVDWSGARLAPRESDVAYCRAHLALHPGGDSADRFLAAYEAATDLRLDALAPWDVLAGECAERLAPMWAASFTERGVEMDRAQICAAARSFTDSALRRLNRL